MGQFCCYKRYFGQGLSEYTLIGALVGIVAIAGLAQLGAHLNTGFDNILSERQPLNVTSIKTTSGKSASNDSTFTLRSGLKFTTTKGSSISLPEYPHKLSQTITTTGANGATTVLANAIKSVADQLLASGEITQTQYNSLIALSNKGHTLAAIEAKYERIIAESSSNREIEKKIDQDPELYAISRDGSYELTLGYAKTGNDPTKLKDPLKDKSMGYVQEFLDEYNAVLKNGSLQDPSVKQVVTSLVANIGYLANATGTISAQIAYDGVSPDQMTSKMTSYLMHQDSAGICAAGQGSDTGFQCSG